MQRLVTRLAVILLSAAGVARAQDDGPAYLVANINRTVDGRAGSSTHAFTTVGTHLYFVADDGTDAHLWRTHLPPRGAVRITQTPGGPWQHPRELIPVGTDLYLLADGLLKVGPGPDAEAVLVEAGPIPWLRRVGDLLFFARDGRLWTTDGRPGMARDVAALPDVEPTYRNILGVAGDRLILVGCQWQTGCLIWQSDGTPEGTGPAALLDGLEGLGGVELPSEHIAIGNVLYFLGQTQATGVELWRTDGTPHGTSMVRDIHPGPANGFVRRYDFYDFRAYFTALGETLCFVASDGRSGFELWRSDGTPEGTQKLADLVPGAAGLFDCVSQDDACDPRFTPTAVLENVLYVSARLPGDKRHWQLWRSDGSAAGTWLAEDDILGPITAGLGGIFFTRRVDRDRFELWHRDDLGPARLVASLPSFAPELHGFEDGVALNVWTEATGYEPWWSDGSAAGTRMIADMRGDDASSEPREFIPLRNSVLFSADDGIHGRELWRSDGTEGGTALIADIAPGHGGSEPIRPIRLGDAVLFVADDGVHGPELWRTDGTTVGTWLVRDIRPGSGGSDPDRFALVGDRVFFFADDGKHGRELWRSDGTRAGTKLVRDLRPGAEGSDLSSPGVRNQVEMAGRLFFLAGDGRGGIALWRSDGTARGTRILSDLGGTWWAEALLTVGNRLFLVVLSEDWELWQSDGTAKGTRPVPALSGVGSLIASDGSLYFSAAGRDGPELWRLDPAEEEPVWIGPLEASSLVDVGGTLFGLVNRRKLWRQKVGEIESYAWIQKLVPLDDRLLLLAGRLGGYECCWAVSLWSTDGTAEGTFQLQYLPPIEDGRDFPDEEPRFVRAGDLVFFNADSGDIGEELWALPFDALSEIQRSETPTPTATPVPFESDRNGGCQLDGRSNTAGWQVAATVMLLLLRRSASRRARHASTGNSPVPPDADPRAVRRDRAARLAERRYRLADRLAEGDQQVERTMEENVTP
jgi:ELWxxDGT repeat protein